MKDAQISYLQSLPYSATTKNLWIYTFTRSQYSLLRLVPHQDNQFRFHPRFHLSLSFLHSSFSRLWDLIRGFARCARTDDNWMLLMEAWVKINIWEMIKRGFNDRIQNATADHIPKRCFILAYYPRHRYIQRRIPRRGIWTLISMIYYHLLEAIFPVPPPTLAATLAWWCNHSCQPPGKAHGHPAWRWQSWR